MILVEFDKIIPVNPLTQKLDFSNLKDLLYDKYIDLEQNKCLFNSTSKIHLNNKELDIISLKDGMVCIDKKKIDINLKEDDVITISLVTPKGAAAGLVIFKLLLSVAISYVLNRILAPDLPTDLDTQSEGGDSENVYSVNSQQNRAKKGETRPVGFGIFNNFFDLISQPYTRYEANVQYLYIFGYLGDGLYNIENLFLDKTNINDLTDLIKYQSYLTQGLEYLGDIKDSFDTAYGDDNFRERVVTSPAIKNIEIKEDFTGFQFDGVVIETTGVDTVENLGYYNEASIFGTFITSRAYAVGEKIEAIPSPSGKWGGLFICVSAIGSGQVLTYTDIGALDGYEDIGATLIFDRTSDQRGSFRDFEVGTAFTVTDLAASSTNYTVKSIINNEKVEVNEVIGATATYFADEVDVTSSGNVIGFYEVWNQENGYNFDKIEWDIVFPAGLYDSDGSGNLTNRSVDIDLICKTFYVDDLGANRINTIEPNYIITESSRKSIRKTFSLAKQVIVQAASTTFGVGFADSITSVSVSVRRNTPAPTTTAIQDQTNWESCKVYQQEDNTQHLTDPTDLTTVNWTKIGDMTVTTSENRIQGTQAGGEPSVAQTFVPSTNYGTHTIFAKVKSSGVGKDDFRFKITGIVAPPSPSRYSDVFTTTDEYQIFKYTFLGVDTLFIPINVAIASKSGGEIDIKAEYVKVLNSSSLPLYPNGTLIGVRVRADSQIGGRFKLNADCERTDVSNDLKSVLEDIYTNSEYGADQDINSIALSDMTEEVNVKFQGQNTVWSAMSELASSFNYNIFGDTNIIKNIQANVDPIRTMTFNDSTIIKGSLKINYQLKDPSDNDGVEVRYSTGTRLEEAFVTFPSNSINPRRVDMIGKHTESEALDRASFMFNKFSKNLINYELQTELDGNLPSLYDRVTIQTHMLNDSESGKVFNYSYPTFTLERVPKYSFASPFVRLRNTKGEISSLISVTINGNIVTLSSDPSFDPLYPPILYSIGESQEYEDDIIVSEISPQDSNIITIKGYNYDSSIYS